MLSRRGHIAIGLILALSIFCAIPRTRVMVPEYQVSVTDGAGRPLANVHLYQHLYDYSSGAGVDRAVDAVTDSAGKASFESVRKAISVGGQVVGCAHQILVAGPHASCGFYSDISALKSSYVEAARRDTKLKGQADKRSLSLTLGKF